MSDAQRPTLRLIHGEVSGQCRPAAGGTRDRVDRRAAPTLTVVPRGPATPHQLTLPGVYTRADTLVSLGVRDLDFTAFATVLQRHGARVVLDARVSPSFRGVGFSVARVEQLFGARGIAYKRFPGLAHVEGTTRGSPHVERRRYEAYLVEEPRRALLDDLRDMIRRGPAVLLGWEPVHEGSDREALIAVLLRAYEDPFDLAVAR